MPAEHKRPCDLALSHLPIASCQLPHTQYSMQSKAARKLAALACASVPGEGDYRLGLGAVLCAEVELLSVLLLIKRISTRRFWARASALLFSAAGLYMARPITSVLCAWI